MSLPFAAYTGLSSTIAVLIGPVGWLAVGGAYAWHLTKPKYKKLTTALLYIIQTNERLKLAEAVLA